LHQYTLGVGLGYMTNRKIMFRAWLEETKEMVIFDSLEITTPILFSKQYPQNNFWQEPGDVKNFRLEASRTNGDNYNHDDFNRPPEEEYILMQDTGLDDKNGVTIYEGDIWSFQGNNIEVDNPILGNFIYIQHHEMNVVKEGEVIGNIHQNPELIK